MRRRKAAAELGACIRTIRDHRRFLLGQTVTEMQEYADDGSVVFTLPSSEAMRSVSRNTVKTVPLSQLSTSHTRAWLSKRWTSKKRFEQKNKNGEF
jgi:hypothetical protein